jgi:hypothetical protein
MAKRKPLSFDDRELSENLGRSAKGIDAFFSPPRKPAGEAETVRAKDDTDGAKSDQRSPTEKPAKRKAKTSEAKLADLKIPSVGQHPGLVEEIIETVRKSVKVVGKEMSTHRMTPKEKQAIVDLVYSYRGTGTRTSENEIARIAINFLIEDYKQNGENSILHKVLRLRNVLSVNSVQPLSALLPLWADEHVDNCCAVTDIRTAPYDCRSLSSKLR